MTPPETYKTATRIARSGEVQIVPVQTFLASYVDRKTGKQEVKLGFRLGTNQVRFLDTAALSGEVQGWLKEPIIDALDALEK